MPEHARERQYRQTLSYSGQAFIVFGLWSIVKLMIQAYLNPLDWAEMEALADIPAHTLKIISLSLFAFILTADILLRLYIGLSAVKEAGGKRKSMVYLHIAALYIFLTIVSLIPGGNSAEAVDKVSLATLFFDATNITTLVIIIVDSRKLRKLRKLEVN